MIPCPIKLAAQKHPVRTALISATQEDSYAQLNIAVEYYAEYLRNFGIKPAERIALVSPPSFDHIALLWACFRLGIVACLVNNRNPSHLIRANIQALSCRLVVSNTRVCVDRTEKMRCLTFKELLRTKKVLEGSRPHTQIHLRGNQPATMIFSSGSTGQPKIIVHSLANHYTNALGSNEHLPFGPSDCWLLSLPLFHVSGLGILFRTFLGGGSLFIPGRREGLETVIQDKAITHISLVPTQLFRLLNHPGATKRLRKFKVILVGGGPISPDLVKAAARYKLPVYLSYGLSEMASQVATTERVKSSDTFPKTKVLPYRELKINNGHEIMVRGKTLFLGYWQDRKIKRPLTNGWFKTGDLAEVDRKGWLIIKGRKDRMFKCRGENVYPEEIERALNVHSDIRRAYVLGRHHPEFGQVPVAFVEFKPKAMVGIPELRSFLAQQLPSYQIPSEYYRWPKSKESTRLKLQHTFFQQLLDKNQAHRVTPAVRHAHNGNLQLKLESKFS